MDQDCDGTDNETEAKTVEQLEVGDLYVSELWPFPAGLMTVACILVRVEAEWIELYNATGVDVALDGLIIKDGQ